MNAKQAVGPSLAAAFGALLGSSWLANVLPLSWLHWAVVFGELHVLLALLLWDAKTTELEATP